jgi:hypothetical protein
MADYSGLEQRRPFSSFIAGMGAADQMQQSSLKNEAMRDALTQQKEQRTAMKQYAATGDDTAIKGVAPEMWIKLDENARKSVEAGMKEFQQIGPYLTTENYSAAWQEFGKTNPGLVKLWPHPSEITDQARLDQFKSRGADFVTKSLANQTSTVGEAQVGVQKQQMEAVTIPTMKLQEQLQEKLGDATYDHNLSLQKNAQTFQEGQIKIGRTLQMDLAKMVDKRTKTDHFFNVLKGEESSINQLYFKGIEAIDKEYGGSTDDPGYNARVGALNRERTKLLADIHEKYAGWAKQSGIDFKSGQTAPATAKSVFKNDAEKSAAQASFEKHMSTTTDPATRKRYLEGAAGMGLDTSKFK